jgi:hypothetical protein
MPTLTGDPPNWASLLIDNLVEGTPLKEAILSAEIFFPHRSQSPSSSQPKGMPHSQDEDMTGA